MGGDSTGQLVMHLENPTRSGVCSRWLYGWWAIQRYSISMAHRETMALLVGHCVQVWPVGAPSGQAQSNWKRTVPSASISFRCPHMDGMSANRMLPSGSSSPIQRPLLPVAAALAAAVVLVVAGVLVKVMLVLLLGCGAACCFGPGLSPFAGAATAAAGGSGYGLCGSGAAASICSGPLGGICISVAQSFKTMLRPPLLVRPVR